MGACVDLVGDKVLTSLTLIFINCRLLESFIGVNRDIYRRNMCITVYLCLREKCPRATNVQRQSVQPSTDGQ